MGEKSKMIKHSDEASEEEEKQEDEDKAIVMFLIGGSIVFTLVSIYNALFWWMSYINEHHVIWMSS